MSESDAGRAFARACAFIELPWAKFRFAGPDRRKFLNGLVTADVARLPEGGACTACLLTPKGLLRAYFLLKDAGEAMLAFCPAECAAHLSATMTKMIMLSESRFEDVSSELALLLLDGPASPDAAAQAAAPLVLPWPRLSAPARLLAAPAKKAPELKAALLSAGAVEASAQDFEIRRVERALPRFGVDMDEDTVPLEARLEDAISFEKGCYMGQETISRVHHLGHINKVLVQLQLDAGLPPEPGAAVASQGKTVGRLTSAAVSPEAGVLALATVQVAFSAPGTALEIESTRGGGAARVVTPR